MECAAAEQSVPLPAASRAAQRLLERGMGLPKVAEATSGSCGGRGWTDGQPASCSSQPRGSAWGIYGSPVAAHGVQGLPGALRYGAGGPSPSRTPLQGLSS